MPRTSIIIPAYNAEAFLADAISSVLSQTTDDWECIITNDGSQDTTAQVIDSAIPTKMAHRFKVITLCRNQGLSNGRNIAIEARADSQYIALGGADDVWLPDHLEVSIATIEREGADFVGGRIRKFQHETGEHLEEWGPYAGWMENIRTSLLGGFSLMNPSTWVFAAEAQNTIGLFDVRLRYCEDMDYLLRMIEAGYNIVLSPKTTTLGRQHAQQMTSNVAKMAEGLSQVFASHESYPYATKSQMRHLASYHAEVAARNSRSASPGKSARLFVTSWRYRKSQIRLLAHAACSLLAAGVKVAGGIVIRVSQCARFGLKKSRGTLRSDANGSQKAKWAPQQIRNSSQNPPASAVQRWLLLILLCAAKVMLRLRHMRIVSYFPSASKALKRSQLVLSDLVLESARRWPPVGLPMMECGTEVHMLLCKRDFSMGLWTIRSLFSAIKMQLPLVVHDDGSLTQADVGVLNVQFPTLRFIPRTDADVFTSKTLSSSPFILSYRSAAGALGLKLANVLAYRMRRRVMVCDSDILFFCPAPDLMRAVLGTVHVPQYAPESQNYYDSISEMKPLGKAIGPFNSGLTIAGTEVWNADAIENVCRHIIELPATAETRRVGRYRLDDQLPLAFVFGKAEAQPLPPAYTNEWRHPSAGLCSKHYMHILKEYYAVEGIWCILLNSLWGRRPSNMPHVVQPEG